MGPGGRRIPRGPLEAQAFVNRLLLLAAAFLFSTGGAAIKATTLTSWQVACFRSAVAAAALLALVPAAHRGWTRRAMLAALPYAATVVLFVLANKLTTAANAIFLQSTAPLYLLLLGPWLLKERVRRADLALAGVLAAGMALFFIGTERAAATAPDPVTGNLIAAASGAAWALTIAGLRWSGGSMSTVAAGSLIAVAITLPMALPVASATPGDWAAIVYLGVFQVGLAYACLTRALRRVPAFEAGALLLVEPALNPVWAYAVHGEQPSVWAVAGGALILAAAIIKARPEQAPPLSASSRRGCS